MPKLVSSVVATITVLALSGSQALAVRDQPRPTTPAFNGSVHAIAHRGDVVYVGGQFTSATSGGRAFKRLRLAAFDARSGRLLPWDPAADGTVRALAATTNGVYAAGDFHTVDGEKRDSLARLHPGTGEVSSFRPTLSGTPYTLAIGNDRLYLGGGFTAVNGYPRANLAAFSLTTGVLDPRWRPAADNTVHAITVDRRRVFVGGGFHTVGGVKGTLRLAKVDGKDGRVDAGFLPRVPAEVRAIAVDPEGVYVATAGVGGRAISYTYAGAVRWQRVFDGDAAALVVSGGITYVGGHFDSACLTSKNGAHGVCADGSAPRYKLAAVTKKGELASWAPQANGVIGVRVLRINRVAGAIEAGGDFTTIAGKPRPRFASF